MAIFQKAYRGYQGDLTSIFWRPLVITRYSLLAIINSRYFYACLVIGLLPSLVTMSLIYVRYNLDMLIQFEIPIDELVRIDADFFADFMLRPQLQLVFLFIMFVAPTLATPDLRNNGLSLYLSRPISKTGYVIGKLLAIISLCSLVTWVPGVLLFFFQAYMGGSDWFSQYYYLPFAIIAASLIWITTLTLFALAISALVKTASIARVVFFGIMLVGAAFGGLSRTIIGGWYGSIFSLSDAEQAMVQTLFGIKNFSTMPSTGAAMVFGLFISLSILILYRRIRGFEVVG